MTTNKVTFKQFVDLIWSHYTSHKREFPWRNTQDPYKIVVSEIMLQQTQTFRVVEKYNNFIEKFPSFNALNKASSRDVLMLWQGLGYNRRALALKKIARIVMEKYNGQLPRTLEELDELPGIGEATAASISAFAFNIPVVFIETNIRRVFIHFFFPRSKEVPDTDLFPLIAKVLDQENAREWYFALMDYGAMLKSTVENPNRRSKHYVKQAVFTGSNREVRGAILKLVTRSKKISEKELLGLLPFDKQKILDNIETLSKEGFFVRKNGTISQ